MESKPKQGRPSVGLLGRYLLFVVENCWEINLSFSILPLFAQLMMAKTEEVEPGLIREG